MNITLISFRKWLIVLICLACCAFPQSTRADEKVTKKEFVALLRGLEESVSGYQWSFSYLGEPRVTGGKPAQINGHVLFDVNRSYYKLEGSSVLDWVSGSADRLSTRFGMSYDGSLYYLWRYDKYGNELPLQIADEELGIEGIRVDQIPPSNNVIPPYGQIDVSPFPGFEFDLYRSSSGLQFLAPFVHPEIAQAFKQNLTTTYSTLIEKCDEKGLSITVDGTGRFYTATFAVPASPYGKLVIEFDSEFFGTARRIYWDFDFNGELKVMLDHELEYQDDGHTPKQLRSNQAKQAFTVEFIDFKVEPTLTVKDFSLRFPPGTNFTQP